jgi:hypothetical protein
LQHDRNAEAFTAFMYSRRMSGSCGLARVFLVCLLVATTSMSISCRRHGAPTRKGNALATASAGPSRPLPPLEARERVVTLALRGLPDAELMLPIGATTPRPLAAILVPTATGLRQQCEVLGRSIAADAFVLCQSTEPKQKFAGLAPGVASGQAASPRQADGDSIASALKAALHSATRRYGRYVSSKELAIVGVNEGASAVASIVRQEPDFFRRVALLDGGFQSWTSVDSVRFVRAGGKALLTRCTREQCRGEAMRVIATARALGIATRLDPDVGSTSAAGSFGAPADEPQLLLRWLLLAGSAP